MSQSQPVYTEQQMFADASRLEATLAGHVETYVGAQNALGDVKFALKEAERNAEDTEGLLRSEQLLLYEAGKTGSANKGVLTASNEPGRKVQLDSYIGICSRKPGSQYNTDMARVQQLRRQVAQADKAVVESKAKLDAVYAVISLRTALFTALGPLNVARAQAANIQAQSEGVNTVLALIDKELTKKNV